MNPNPTYKPPSVTTLRATTSLLQSPLQRIPMERWCWRLPLFRLYGRRGFFDGTVKNMHLHWKYRELVKVIVEAKNFSPIRSVALALEAESGGILVSVDNISNGFAIIVYRGKDYQRPPTPRPNNLLTKRKAPARSIELQRHEALKNHIEKLRSELGQMEDLKEQGDEDLYSKLDSSYSTEDKENEGWTMPKIQRRGTRDLCCWAF